MRDMKNCKNSKGLLTIKAFADKVGLSTHKLRHYDRTGVFFPDLHDSNYRYYSFKQLTMIRMIDVLQGVGVPFDIVRAYNKDRSPEKAMKLFNEYLDKAAEKVRHWSEVKSLASTYMELLYEGTRINEAKISLALMQSKKIILGDANDFSDQEVFYEEYQRFRDTPHIPKQNLPFPVGGYFSSMDAYLRKPSQPTHFFSIDPKGEQERPEGYYIVGYTRGYYGQTNDLPQRMSAFAKHHGVRVCGPVYNSYLYDELSIARSDQYLLQSAAYLSEAKPISSGRSRILRI